jgi:heme exporter protein A
VASRESAGAVELVRVSKTYGPVRALTGVDARFELGTVTAVLGANGSGKSTLLSLVATLARPTSGVVTHGSLGRTREEVRRVLGWVGHESLCYGDLTGRENLRFAGRLYGLEGDAAVERVAKRFELGGAYFDRPFRTYSRGQRQRVALARALLHEPMLVLLDEPTTGLDASGCAHLTEVVKEEASRGAVVVVVTHDESFARAVATQEVRLERGRIVVADQPAGATTDSTA